MEAAVISQFSHALPNMFGTQPIIIIMENHISPVTNINHAGDVRIDQNFADVGKMDVSQFLKVLEPQDVSDQMILNIINGFNEDFLLPLEEPEQFRKCASKKFSAEIRVLAKKLNSRVGYARYFEYMSNLILEEAKKNYKTHPDVCMREIAR